MKLNEVRPIFVFLMLCTLFTSSFSDSVLMTVSCNQCSKCYQPCTTLTMKQLDYKSQFCDPLYQCNLNDKPQTLQLESCIFDMYGKKCQSQICQIIPKAGCAQFYLNLNNKTKCPVEKTLYKILFNSSQQCKNLDCQYDFLQQNNYITSQCTDVVCSQMQEIHIQIFHCPSQRYMDSQCFCCYEIKKVPQKRKPGLCLDIDNDFLKLLEKKIKTLWSSIAQFYAFIAFLMVSMLL